MKKMTIMLSSVFLFAFSQQALAEEKADAKTKVKAKAKLSASSDSDSDQDSEEDVRLLPIESGMYVDVGGTVDFQLPVWSPDNIGKGYAVGVSFLDAHFGLCKRKFCHGPTLGIGAMWAGVTDGNRLRHDDARDAKFLGSVGYKMFEYIGTHVSFNQALSMPLTPGGPGAQLDLGFAVLPNAIGGQYFGFDIGVSVSYLQTGMTAAGTDDVHWLGVGGYIGISWEAWGRYVLRDE